MRRARSHYWEALLFIPADFTINKFTFTLGPTLTITIIWGKVWLRWQRPYLGHLG